MQKNTGPEEDSGFNPTLLIAFGICALLAAGVIFWSLSGTNDINAASFEFEALNIDAQKLQAQRDAKFKSVQLDRVPREWQQFLSTAREVNRFGFGSPGQVVQAATIQKLGYHSSELIPATGYEGFVAATLPLRDACGEGLDTLREALGSGKLELKLALTDPPAERFAQYRDNCGNQLPMLIQRGLLTERGAWTSKDAPIIADIVSRYRWAHLLEDQYSPWLLLTSYETEIFARWRVEQATGYSPQKRLEFLEEIHQLLPDYSVDLARGILAFQDNNRAGALKYFQRLQKSDPAAGYDAYIRYLKEQGSEG